MAKTLDKTENTMYTICRVERKVHKDITILPSVWEKAQERAAECGISVSALISLLIQKGDIVNEIQSNTAGRND